MMCREPWSVQPQPVLADPVPPRSKCVRRFSGSLWLIGRRFRSTRRRAGSWHRSVSTAIQASSCVAAAEVDIRIGVVAARTGVAHGVADPGLAAGVGTAGSVRSCCPPCGLSSREWVIPRDDSPIAGCWLDIHVRSSAVTRPVASRYRRAGIWISGALSREPCSRARRLGAEPWGASCSCGRSSDRSRIVICGCVMLVTRAGRLCIFGRFRWQGRAVARARGCRRDGGDCTHSQEDAVVAAAKTSGQVVSSMPVEP